MVAVGAAPAFQQAAAPLIAAGAALAAASLVYPRLQSIDFGSLKIGLKPDEDVHRSIQADIWRLQRFAWLVCGDAESARDLVEEALADTRLLKLSPDERGALTLQSLVVLLENARERDWLRPPAEVHETRTPLADNVVAPDSLPIKEVLAGLPVRSRIAYLLCSSWLLPLDEVVKIVAGSPEEVREAVMQGRLAFEGGQ